MTRRRKIGKVEIFSMFSVIVFCTNCAIATQMKWDWEKKWAELTKWNRIEYNITTSTRGWHVFILRHEIYQWITIVNKKLASLWCKLWVNIIYLNEEQAFALFSFCTQTINYSTMFDWPTCLRSVGIISLLLQLLLCYCCHFRSTTLSKSLRW